MAKEEKKVENVEHAEHAEEHKGHAHTAHHTAGNAGNTKLWIMAAVLGLLIILAGVQAVQLAGIKEKIASGPAVSTAGGNTQGGAPATNLKKSLDSLPQMVGGC
ncbi:hypothetical protein HZB01_04740 [Candidatus Woesearchaeota archaeon]|nr:hypothetical protein [Candidatus Woesearchaeota archaeon]